MVVVSPQCPTDHGGNPSLTALLDEVAKQRIDKQRVYDGLSMGGLTALASHTPERLRRSPDLRRGAFMVVGSEIFRHKNSTVPKTSRAAGARAYGGGPQEWGTSSPPFIPMRATTDETYNACTTIARFRAHWLVPTHASYRHSLRPRRNAARYAGRHRRAANRVLSSFVFPRIHCCGWNFIGEGLTQLFKYILPAADCTDEQIERQPGIPRSMSHWNVHTAPYGRGYVARAVAGSNASHGGVVQ
jgi:hypothetical protein